MESVGYPTYLQRIGQSDRPEFEKPWLLTDAEFIRYLLLVAEVRFPSPEFSDTNLGNGVALASNARPKHFRVAKLDTFDGRVYTADGAFDSVLQWELGTIEIDIDNMTMELGSLLQTRSPRFCTTSSLKL